MNAQANERAMLAASDSEESTNNQEGKKPQIGKFFSLDLSQIDTIVETGGTSAEVIAYLVVARGVNRPNETETRISTYGANSVANRSGMSHTKATEALGWLEAAGYIRSTGEYADIPQQLGKGTSIQHRARWVLPDSGDNRYIYMPNSLIDGVGAGKVNPPIQRIYLDSENRLGQSFENVRLDTLMLLLHLYDHHDIATWGGVSPRSAVYREYVATQNANGEMLTDLPGTNFVLGEIQRGRRHGHPEFGASALSYVPETELPERFLNAFDNLYRLGFLYEVIQIWSGNPNSSSGKNAEVLYTLYIYDRHIRERKSEPYLQSEIHDAAFRVGAMDAAIEFSEKGRRCSKNDFPDNGNILNSGRFRYITVADRAVFPIGIYRLRHRPHTRDVGLGMRAEESRVRRWAEALQRIEAPRIAPE